MLDHKMDSHMKDVEMDFQNGTIAVIMLEITRMLDVITIMILIAIPGPGQTTDHHGTLDMKHQHKPVLQLHGAGSGAGSLHQLRAGETRAGSSSSSICRENRYT